MKIKKILSGSFLIVMAIHLVVFTSVGFFTSLGWRLLWIFLAGMAILGVVYGLWRLCVSKRKNAA